MKYIFAIPRMGGGGAERVLANQANEFAQMGHDITILTIVGGESFYPLSEKVHYISANVKINRRNIITSLLSQSIGFFKAYRFFRKTIKETKADAVISIQRQVDIICYAVKKTGVQFPHICHEINDPYVRNRFIQWLLKKIYRDSALLICQSQAVSDYYHMVPRKVVIPNPINPALIPERFCVDFNKVVAVGRLDRQKNFQMLINAFVKVLDTHPNCRLEIFGEGPLRYQLQTQINSLKLTDHIILRGSKSEVMKYICDAAVFAMSSDYEGMPNALLEAMAIGIPVVCTDFATGVARELIESENGYIVPVGDKDAMTRAICDIISHPERQDKISENNRKKMKAFYNEVIMEKWINAFQSIKEWKD